MSEHYTKAREMLWTSGGLLRHDVADKIAALLAREAQMREALAHTAGELQFLRNHVAHWERSGIDTDVIARADAALAPIAAEPAQPEPAGFVDCGACPRTCGCVGRCMKAEQPAEPARPVAREAVPVALPEPRTLSRGDEDGAIKLGYTADQMLAYAASARTDGATGFRSHLITEFCAKWSGAEQVAAGDVLDWIMALPDAKVAK